MFNFAEMNNKSETDSDVLEDYIAAHIDAEPAALHALYRRTNLTHLYPRMCSGHVQGRVLRMLVAMAAPRRILELGAFTGYSTLCLAEGMPRGCTLDTVEIDDEMEQELADTLAASPRGGDIYLHIGDALEIVPRLEGTWDFVFIDANKRHYKDYFRMVLDRVPVGGFILADNTLWGGHLTAHTPVHDAQSRGIAEFNDYVAACSDVEKIILPLRDGLTITRRVR